MKLLFTFLQYLFSILKRKKEKPKNPDAFTNKNSYEALDLPFTRVSYDPGDGFDRCQPCTYKPGAARGEGRRGCAHPQGNSAESFHNGCF